MQLRNIIYITLRIIAAAILWQTLYFKFSAHPESVALFSKLGVEPWGRMATGIIELITGLLLLIPATVFIGAVLGIGLMTGAIIAHLSVIGISSGNDGGQLFIYALITFAICCTLSIAYKKQGLQLIKSIYQKEK